jgi:hypothetical protein
MDYSGAREALRTVFRTAQKMSYRCLVVKRAKVSCIHDTLRPFCKCVTAVEALPKVFAVIVTEGSLGVVSTIGKCRVITYHCKEVDALIEAYLLYLEDVRDRIKTTISIVKEMGPECHIWPMPHINNHPQLTINSFAVIPNESADDDDMILTGKMDGATARMVIPYRQNEESMKARITRWFIALLNIVDLDNTFWCCNCRVNMEDDWDYHFKEGVPTLTCDDCFGLLCNDCREHRPCSMCRWTDPKIAGDELCTMRATYPELRYVITMRSWNYIHRDIGDGNQLPITVEFLDEMNELSRAATNPVRPVKPVPQIALTSPTNLRF